MARKKSPLDSAGRRKRAYELNGMPISYPMDPLKELEVQSIRDLSNEYRQLQIETMINRKRQQLQKTEAGSSSDVSLQKQNLELVTTIFKLAKELQPQQPKQDDTVKYVGMFKDLMLESAKMANQGGQGPSFFEKMLVDQNLYSRTQDLFSKGQTGDANQFSLEIEKLKGERQLQFRKFDLEMQKDRLNNERRMQQLNMVLGSLSPIMNLGVGKLEEQVRNRGRDFATQQNPMPNPHLQTSTYQGELAKIEIGCSSCGFKESMLLPDPPPSSIPCPGGCGETLVIRAEEVGSEVQDWAQKGQNF